MRLSRIAPLLLLSATLLAATCVTNVQQKGPAGPWVGEVVNSGNQTVWDVTATARIFDGNGTEFGVLGVRACPEVLLPGQHGAFELHAVTEGRPFATEQSPARAEFLPAETLNDGFGRTSGDGLLAATESLLDQGRVANVRVTNSSEHSYEEIQLCGVRLGAGGAPSSVSFAFAERNTRLDPGDSIMLSLFFEVRTSGAIRLYPSGVADGAPPACCPASGASTWQSVDTGPFSVLLPPGWVYEPRQGIDSFVGAFIGDGVELFFDYGWYSGDPEDPSDPTQDVQLESIAGRTAKIVVGGTYAALHIGVTATPPDDPLAGITPVDLITIYGESLTASLQDIALQIFRSIRFDAP